MALTIAVDAMSGDHGVSTAVDAVPLFLARLNEQMPPTIILVGDSSVIKDELTKLKLHTSDTLRIQHASEVVDMAESPSSALRGKKDSSMRVAINLVKQGDADVAISAGNTGALMATAKFVLKTIPGIDRPALCTRIPTLNTAGEIGHVHILDLGANIDSSAAQLAQFSMMGSILCQVVDGKADPVVCLLNIGQEEVKGNEQVKEAAELISQTRLNYQGFVEGDTIFTGKADVVVCDGFVGNAVLKTMEGTAKLLSNTLRQEYQRNWFTKMAAGISLPILKRFSRRVDPRNYNGAPMLGLNGLVFKSHGSADAKSFANAIYQGYVAAKNNLVSSTSDRIAHSALNQQRRLDKSSDIDHSDDQPQADQA